MTYSYKILWKSEYYDLPNYQSMSFGYDYNDVGAITFKYPRNGVNADVIRNPYATIITYWDGVEVDNSRFMVMAVDDSYDPEDVYFTVKGRTLHDVFRKTIARKPSEPGKPYRFSKATAGGILNTLFGDAQARGAMQGITWDFTASKTSGGKAWDKSITIEYKPGTKYLDIVRNLADQGMIDFSFVGNTFKGFNDSENSKDYATDTGKQIELRAGLDYEEMPMRMSVEDRANYSFVLGNEALWSESTRVNEELSPYGREEQAISQGGMNDVSSMALVNETSLFSASRTKNEYTRKVIIRQGGPVPGVDYKPGDWVLDRLGNGLPVRYRVISIAVGVNDRGQATSAAITLNDKIQEYNLKLSRKVDGIIGGASASGSSNGLPVDSQKDTTVPMPPTGLLANSSTYYDNNGVVRGMASSTWLKPTANTDGSALSDFSHYEVQHQIDGSIVYGTPTDFGPLKPASDLMRRFDRRGLKTPGWLGADGGGNFANTQGEIFHVWGDTLYGTITADGKRNATMPRNSMTSFSPTGGMNLGTYVGVENCLPLEAARTDSVTPWVGIYNCTRAVASWVDGYGGNAIEMTATASGTVAVNATTVRTTSQGASYSPIRAGYMYRVMCKFDTTPMASPRVNLIWYNSANAVITTSAFGSNAGEIDAQIVAPAGAVRALFQVLGTATAAGQKIKFSMPGLFETNHQMQNWRLPEPGPTVYNEVLNPDGADTTNGAVAKTNYQTNPGIYSDVRNYSGTGNGVVWRDLQEVPGKSSSYPLVNVQNPGVLNKWFSALDNRTNAPANMVAVGTSVTSGLTTTNFRNRYQTRLSDLLRGTDYKTQNVGTSGPGVGYQGVSGYIPGYYQGAPWLPNLPGPDGQGSGGGQSIQYGLGGQTLALGAGDYRRFKARFTDLVVFLVQEGTNGAPLTLTVDGVEQKGTTVIGTAASPRTVAWDTQFKNLPDVEHVVEIRNTNAPGTWGSVNVCGFHLFSNDRNAGVHVIDGSKSGWSAKEFVTYASTIAPAYALMRPHLVTIEFGYNDAGAGRTSAQFKADLQTIITSIKNACSSFGTPAPAFLLVGGYDPGSAQYGNATNPPGSWPEPWANYLTAMSQVATADSANVAFVDLSTVMPRISDDNTGLYDGAIHPNDKGHNLMANILRGVLSPAYSSNRLASVRVNTAANTANSGLQTTADATANWASGDKWVYSFDVFAPVGAKLSATVTSSPSAPVSVPITGSGTWQRVTVAGSYTATPTAGPLLRVATADTTQPSSKFWVSRIQLEKSDTASDYFDGETTNGTLNYAWAGTRFSSVTYARVQTPVGYSVGPGCTVATTREVTRYNATSIQVDATNATGTPYASFGLSLPAGTQVTLICHVYSTVDTTAFIRMQNGGTILSPNQMINVKANTWTEVRSEGVMTGASNIVLVGWSNKTVVYLSEMTVVTGGWTGSSFSGSSTNGESIACSWTGVPNKSRSKAVFNNSNKIELGFNFFGDIATADRVVQLVNTLSTPGGNSAEWLWAADGAVTTGNKAVVFYNTVMSEASIKAGGWNFGYNGSYYIAEFDLINDKMTGFRRWSRDPRGGKQSISWGNAVYTYQGYTYVYGSRATFGHSYNNENYVCRMPATSAYSAKPEVWTAAGWKATTDDPGMWETNSATTPKSIATTPWSGFSSVRVTKDGVWKALVMGGLSRDLAMWTASDAPGAWSFDKNIYTMPSSGLLGYSPKFQPASDSNALGAAVLICQSSGDSLMNPTLYIPQWLRGPAGKASAALGSSNWIDLSTTYEEGFVKGDLKPGSVYAIRVRAVDNANPAHYSQWVGSDPILIAQDTQGPNKPSTPTVTPFFQGARVIWDGYDEAGQPMPVDYARFEVHISTDEAFTPVPATLADSMATRGGTSPIQGLPYGTKYWVKIVAFDTSGNASEPSDGVSVEPQRLSDPDLPDKLITGAKIADKAINTANLTVGSFSDSLIPNGNMEDSTPQGTVTNWSGYFCEDPIWDNSNSIAGSASMRYDVGTAGNKNVLSLAIPITPGDIYYIAAKVRTDRPLDKASVTMTLAVAGNESDAGSGFGKDIRLGTVGSTGGTSVTKLESQAEVPWDDNIKFGRIAIMCETEATPYKVWFDDIEVRKIVGEAAIANASINSAKIKNLAVDDSKIANLSVGKVTAGRIYSDWVQSGRLLTPTDSTGAWSLMDSVGFHVFKDAAGTNRSFDTSGGNTWMSGVLEASEIRGGTAYIPSQYANVPGRTVLSSQGFVVDAVPTTNLCTTPSAEDQFKTYLMDSSVLVEYTGAAVGDFAGNVDIVANTGVTALKVSNKTKNGWIEIELGRAQPNTTYTASWYSASTRIDDRAPGWDSVFGDYGNMGVIRSDKDQRIATGRSGYVVRTGSLQGLWELPKSSGIDLIAYPGWNMRTYLTFKTPADLPQNTLLTLRLPSPRTQSNGNETTMAVCYDSFQLEEKPWMTRYCDGDQPDCVWTGTRQRSTSRRDLVRSAWFPTQEEPIINGRVEAAGIETKRIKIGSGVTHGSNTVETLMGNSWSVWNGGAGWWSQIVWDDGFEKAGTTDSRRSSDDGVAFPPGGGMDFRAVTGGMYALTATITFPTPERAGITGIRLMHRPPAGNSKPPSILASNFQSSDAPSTVVSVSWVGWSPRSWSFYFEAFQTTQSGSATMFSHGATTPCRASFVQLP